MRPRARRPTLDGVIACLALCALLAPLAPLPARAQDNGLRIGVVDRRKAVFNCQEGRAAQEQFAKLEETKREELRPTQELLRALQEEYEKQKFVLSPEALQDKRLEIVKQQRDLERAMREAEDDLQIRQLQLLQPIQKKLARVVKEVGKERDFTLIVDNGTEGFLYFQEGLDVTDVVIEKLNAN